jgi:hypothetical protein
MSGLISMLETVVLAQSEQPDMVPIDMMWKHITSLDLVEAVTFVAFGVV